MGPSTENERAQRFWFFFWENLSEYLSECPTEYPLVR